MKAYERKEKVIYEPVKAAGSSKLGKLLLLGAAAAGAYRLYKNYTSEEQYKEFDADLGNGTGSFDMEADEEEKFASKILKAAKKTGKDVESAVKKVKEKF